MTTIAVPHRYPPPQTLSVLVASTGQTVTVVLEDGGMETVGALVPKIEQELNKATGNAKVCVMRLACGTMILWVRGCSLLENTSSRTLDYYLLDGEVWIVTTRCIDIVYQISVKDLFAAFRTRTVYASASDTIAYVKNQLEHIIGVPADEQRWILNTQGIGKQLESIRTLSDYNISKDSDITLVRRLRGAGPAPGVVFVDVSNPSGPTRQRWSTSAPEWRIARPGLCVEGVCKKRGCSAYKHHVIMNRGYTRFDLIDDGHNCICPLCDTFVVPTTCAFSNCRWKWVGKKIDPRTRCTEVVRSSGWNTADDAYHRFDEDTSGNVNWLHLTITTEPTTSEEITCAVCLGEHVPEYDQMALECGHKFHRSCLKNSTCPLCRAQSHMTAFQRKEAGLTKVQ